MFGNPCSVRKRSTSSSGLIPGSSLRNTFSTSCSSNTIEELDCSTPIGATSASLGRGRACRRTGAKLNRPRRSRSRRSASIRRSSSRASDGVRPARRTPSTRRSGRSRAARPRASAGAQPERQLVELVRAGGKPRLHEREHEQRRPRAGSRSRRSRSRRRRATWTRTSAGAGPSRAGSPRRGAGGSRRLSAARGQSPPPSSSSTSSNQKKPRGAERQQVGELADPREARAAEQLDRVAALVGAEVELDRLGGAGDVVHAQHEVILEAPQVGEDPRVGRLDRLVGSEAEHRVLLAQRDEAVDPAQQRGRRCAAGPRR